MSGYAEYESVPSIRRQPTSIAVRVATADDAPAIASVERAARGVVPEGFLEAVRILPTRPDALVLVATVAPKAGTDDGLHFVGWTGARHRDPADAPAGWYISGLAVIPDARRRGVAQALLLALREAIPGEAGPLRSIVNARNLASLALHRSCGYNELSRGPTFLGVQFTGGKGVLLELPRN